METTLRSRVSMEYHAMVSTTKLLIRVANIASALMVETAAAKANSFVNSFFNAQFLVFVFVPFFHSLLNEYSLPFR
jgi:hypothetical protein